MDPRKLLAASLAHLASSRPMRVPVLKTPRWMAPEESLTSDLCAHTTHTFSIEQGGSWTLDSLRVPADWEVRHEAVLTTEPCLAQGYPPFAASAQGKGWTCWRPCRQRPPRRQLCSSGLGMGLPCSASCVVLSGLAGQAGSAQPREHTSPHAGGGGLCVFLGRRQSES